MNEIILSKDEKVKAYEYRDSHMEEFDIFYINVQYGSEYNVVRDVVFMFYKEHMRSEKIKQLLA